jgi:hypothetical protein
MSTLFNTVADKINTMEIAREHVARNAQMGEEWCSTIINFHENALREAVIAYVANVEDDETRANLERNLLAQGGITL